VPSDFYS